MTNQEKKAYLSGYKAGLLEIEQLEEEIKRLGAQAEGMRSMGGGVAGSSGDNPMQACIDQMLEFQRMLTERLAENMKLRGSIENSIAAVEDAKLRLLLRYRYIEGMKWEEISLRMNYDYRWVLRLHGQALSQLTIESHITPMILLS